MVLIFQHASVKHLDLAVDSFRVPFIMGPRPQHGEELSAEFHSLWVMGRELLGHRAAQMRFPPWWPLYFSIMWCWFWGQYYGVSLSNCYRDHTQNRWSCISLFFSDLASCCCCQERVRCIWSWLCRWDAHLRWVLEVMAKLVFYDSA